MVEYLSGNRIQGSSTLTTPAPATAWKELARATAGSGGSTALTTSAFTAKDNIMILYNSFGSDPYMQVGSGGTIDTGTSYALRYSENGGGDGTNQASYTRWNVNGGAGATGSEGVFGLTEGVNVASQEKLFILRSGDNASGTGTGTATGRYERAMKWVNTSAQINIVKLFHTSGTLDEGSEIIVLGCDNDEADSGTVFWQELNKTTLTSSADTLTTGATSAISKKYLWVRAVLLPTGGNIRTDVRLNNDNGNNYTRRRSNNGASDSTGTGESSVDVYGDDNQIKVVEFFIINRANREKIMFGDIYMRGDEGACNNTNRTEFSANWVNTSDLISRITVNNTGASGSYNTGSYIQVWGSD